MVWTTYAKPVIMNISKTLAASHTTHNRSLADLRDRPKLRTGHCTPSSTTWAASHTTHNGSLTDVHSQHQKIGILIIVIISERRIQLFNMQFNVILKIKFLTFRFHFNIYNVQTVISAVSLMKQICETGKLFFPIS